MTDDTMTLSEPELLSVPVDGGELTVARWGKGDTIVVAPHGITANHVSWTGVAAKLGDDVTLLAPDLRGRGDSADVGEPFGMGQHARDCAAILDHVGADTGILAGHSMGGFVAIKAGLIQPERWDALIMIDGGIGLPIPDGVPIDDVLQAVIGPAMERLQRSFGSREEYRDYWRVHPAFAESWSGLVERYVDYDIAQDADGTWSSRVRIEAIRADGADSLRDESLVTAFDSVSLPVRFIWAAKGIMDADPLYPRELVEAKAAQHDNLELVSAPEQLNHYTLLLSDDGAAFIADQIRQVSGA